MTFDTTITLTKTVTDPAYTTVTQSYTERGETKGLQTFGRETWNKRCYPSEEKFRIWTPPTLSGGTLELNVTPFGWDNLQRYKQVQEDGDFDHTTPSNWHQHAIALTGNGLIQTEDDQLIFHYKKGGAKQGSIHTFGGYASREDLERGGIERTILRELSERNEVGLTPDEMRVTTLFGTLEGQPSVLWGFGTGAVYGLVRTSLTVEEVQSRVNQLDPTTSESLVNALYVVPIDDVARLSQEPNIHPQTRKVLPVIEQLFR